MWRMDGVRGETKSVSKALSKSAFTQVVGYPPDETRWAPRSHLSSDLERMDQWKRYPKYPQKHEALERLALIDLEPAMLPPTSSIVTSPDEYRRR